MSGELLRVMIVRGRSTVTLVRSGGGASSSASRASSHSPSTSRAGRLKRALNAFWVAPRAGGGGGLGTPTCCAQYWNKSRTIFMLAQAGHQFHEVAGPMPAVELGGQYAVPSGLHRAGRSRQIGKPPGREGVCQVRVYHGG